MKFLLIALSGISLAASATYFVDNVDVDNSNKRAPRVIQSTDSFDVVKSEIEGYNQIVFKPIELTEEEKKAHEKMMLAKREAKKERVDYYGSILRGDYRVDFSTKQDITGSIFEEALTEFKPNATYVRDLYHKIVFTSPLSSDDIVGMIEYLEEDDFQSNFSIQLPFLSEDGEYQYVRVENCEKNHEQGFKYYLNCNLRNISISIIETSQERAEYKEFQELIYKSSGASRGTDYDTFYDSEEDRPFIRIATGYNNTNMPRTVYFMYEGSNDILMFNYLAIDESKINQNANKVIHYPEYNKATIYEGFNEDRLIMKPILKKAFQHESISVN